MKLTRILAWVIPFAVAFVFIKPLGQKLRSWMNEPDYVALSAELKRKLGIPKKIDQVTTMIDAKLEPNATSYWHVVDTNGLNIDFSQVEKNVQRGLCSGSAAADIRKGIAYNYHYSDPSGRHLASIRIQHCP
ncbi:MAG: hypothetical protein KF835_00290 [Xanthobacteraceae bacterium]|nr:hypothetical protein [Xanthobacteraceae bacterium]